MPHPETRADTDVADVSIGRIVSVTGSKAIVLLDNKSGAGGQPMNRPEMGTLLAIETTRSISLGLVSALSVPVPAQREGDPEIWIAELGLVGELAKNTEGVVTNFNRGVSAYPALGDRVRVASKAELITAFAAVGDNAVRVGSLRQDDSIAAMVKTDDLLGKHFAILGTTGTGKSCTTALILRAILDKNPLAHIVLLDPHNEYATSFQGRAEVISPRDMQLPYWLLTFEELVEVIFGDPGERKQEVETLQELIPQAKARYTTGRGREGGGMKRSSFNGGRYTVDTPVPYRMSDLLGMLDDKMGLLENKRDISPYRNLKARIEMLAQDQRYGFMFGHVTINDNMADILGRFFRVPVNGKPITILELTGIPTEIVNVVVSVLCRLTFDFALWGDGHVPVTLVCEEAHRYVPSNPALGFEPAKRAIAKIAKEGRKYGASLCIVTQRPAEIDPTILSQCNTVFALRMANDRDQEIVRSAVADTGSGLLEFLPSLGAREAIAFGDGVSLPTRIRFDMLPKDALPRSSTAKFSEKWNSTLGDANFLNQVVERWRTAGSFAINGMDENPDPNADVANGDANAVAEAPAASPMRERLPADAGQMGGMRPAAGGMRQSLLKPAGEMPSRSPAPGEPQAPLRRANDVASLLRRKDPAGGGLLRK